MAVTIKGFASDWSVPEPAKAGLGEVAAATVAEHVVTYPVRAGEVGVTTKRFPYGDVRRYGAVPDANYHSSTDGKMWTTVSRTVAPTDNTAAFQAAVDSVLALGGGTVTVPHGKYLVNGTVTIRTSQSPLVIQGEGMAPMLGTNMATRRFSGIMRDTAGTVFRVNMTDTGDVQHFQSTLQVTDLTVFNGNQNVSVVAFEWLSIRGIFRNVSGFQLAYLIFEPEKAAGAALPPYSDQGVYDNIRMVYSTLGGIKLHRCDATSFRNIYFEYPNATAESCLWIIEASGVTMENFLYSDGRQVVTDKLATFWSGLIMLHNVSGATIRDIHTERIKLGSIVKLYTSQNIDIHNIQARFSWNRVVMMEGCRGVTVDGVDMRGLRNTTGAATVHFGGSVSSMIDLRNMRGANYEGATNDGVTVTNSSLHIPSSSGLLQANVWYDGAAWQVKALTGADMTPFITAAWDSDGVLLTFVETKPGGMAPPQFTVSARPPAAGKPYEASPAYISAQTAKIRFWDAAGVRVNTPDAQMSASVMMKLN